MARVGANMRAFLNNIQAEPGEWTAPDLAKDFGVRTSSVRRTLRQLEEMGLIRRAEGKPPVRGGRVPFRWYPVEGQSLP